MGISVGYRVGSNWYIVKMRENMSKSYILFNYVEKQRDR